MLQSDVFYTPVDTPCWACGHTRRTYKRTIHREMVKFMRVLATAGVGKVVDIRKAMPGASKASTDASYLVHWGFVEKPRHGCYALTPSGLMFLNEGGRTSKYIYLRNNKVVGFSGVLRVSDVKGFDRDDL